MMSPVRVEHPDEGLCLITIDRADARNALNDLAYAQLIAALDDAEADHGVRVIVVTGAHGHFTAGNDLADFQAMPADAQSVPGIRFLARLNRLEKPILAAVEGIAVGIGLTMLLHCDLVYAGRSARLRAPFVQLGLTPEGGSSLLLPLLLGHRRAAEILLCGDWLSAMRAEALDIVNETTEDGMALERALQRAAQLAALPPQALRATRQLMCRARQTTIDETIMSEERVFLDHARSAEARAAFSSFFQKR
ncbi:enoyl-CoA hydratase (plasmid) [Azospirillum sp. B510]|uniref:enoyl-CoA hydratase-related protein n=1 Tax=Azospirillum sp. (strain B510) TaxID=137722 RepID=UPI0001C4B8BF|nr:enoyl-CoA hydratase-related protein [Azospirillum sp. B510]BAI74648.1 enoyl-CoA hydratase [Azospirillum sp. B510]